MRHDTTTTNYEEPLYTGGPCGIYLRAGQEYVLFAYTEEQGGNYRTSMCMGTEQATKSLVKQVEDITGPGQHAVDLDHATTPDRAEQHQPRSSAEEGGQTTLAGTGVVLIAAATLLIGVGLGFAVGRYLPRRSSRG